MPAKVKPNANAVAVGMLLLVWALFISTAYSFILPHHSNFSSKVNTKSFVSKSQPETSDQRLEEMTRKLLFSRKAGKWTERQFYDAKDCVRMYAQRQNRRSALAIERLLRRVVEERMAGNQNCSKLDMVPLYTFAIKGWANSGERTAAAQRAEEILDYMQHLYEHGELELKPRIAAWNAVLMAYGNSRQNDAPQQAMRVLQKLSDYNAEGRTDVVPNKESYASILRAYAKVGGKEAPALVHKLLCHMEKISMEGFPSVRPDYTCHNVYLSTLLESSDRGYLSGAQAAQRATDYLFQMMKAEHDDERPDVWAFNMCIAAWSRSGSPKIVPEAERLVTQLEAYHVACGYTKKTLPATTTYNSLIACYGRSSAPDKALRAHAVLNRMKAFAEDGTNPSAAPDCVTYNAVMNAYAKSQEKDAPFIVERLLREMQDKYEETGAQSMKPTSRSFNTCVDCWAKSSQPNAAERITDWIAHIERNAEQGLSLINTNKYTYASLLQAISKKKHPGIGDEAEKILEKMENLCRKGRTGLKPDVLIYTNVIHCLALSGADDSVERAMQILERMEDLHASGVADVGPNIFTFNCVINAAAKSNRPGKAMIALQILNRMKSVALRPMAITYNNVLNACAFSSPTEDDPQEVLQIALDTLDETHEECGCNYISYITALRVVANFERDRSRRWRLSLDIFRRCCNDGQLTKSIMKQLATTFPPAQFDVLRKEATDDRTGRLKQEYTKNALLSKQTPAVKRR